MSARESSDGRQPSTSPEVVSQPGSPSREPLRDLVYRVYEQTWCDFYAWAPPRTLPLRTTVLPQITESEFVQAQSLRDVVQRAQAAKERIEASSGKGKGKAYMHAGASRSEETARMNPSVSTTWIYYRSMPRSGARKGSTSRSASVVTTPTVPSSSAAPWPTRTLKQSGLPSSTHVFLNRERPVRPVPKYTFCHYTNENVANFGTGRLAFLPTFDDDTHFDQKGYEQRFSLTPEWEDLDRDPDIDIILLETLQRLRSGGCRASTVAIDSTRVLPQKCLAITEHELGRCLPPFPDAPGSASWQSNPDDRRWRKALEVPDIELAEPSTFRDWAELVCPADSCGAAACPIHVRNGHHYIIPPRAERERAVFPNPWQSRPDNACSGDCFVDLPKASEPRFSGDSWLLGHRATEGNKWLRAEQGRLRLLLEDGHNLYKFVPCDLKALFKSHTCAEIAYEIIRQVVAHSSPGGPLSEPAFKRDPRVPQFDRDPSKMETTYRCFHPGPCLKGSCPCVDHGTFCETHCYCDASCQRRHPGCSCRRTQTKEPCHSDKCECVRAQRECDPRKCGDCGAPELLHRPIASDGVMQAGGDWHKKSTVPLGPGAWRTRCRNITLQLGRQAKVRVEESTVAGYGLFADEEIEKYDTITEYVGELIPSREGDRRDMIYRQTRRNYLFGLTLDRLIDAAHLGNMSRYINDGEKIKSNCGVKIVQVLGDHRIKIFAKRRIQRHEELFIDYGDEFHLHQTEGARGKEKSDTGSASNGKKRKLDNRTRKATDSTPSTPNWTLDTDEDDERRSKRMRSDSAMTDASDDAYKPQKSAVRSLRLPQSKTKSSKLLRGKEVGA